MPPTDAAARSADTARGERGAAALPARLAQKIMPARPGLPLPHRGASHDPQAERRILARLSPSPTDENTLIRETGITAETLAPLLIKLELEGRLSRMAGGQISLV